jgi:hypothetical protein
MHTSSSIYAQCACRRPCGSNISSHRMLYFILSSCILYFIAVALCVYLSRGCRIVVSCLVLSSPSFGCLSYLSHHLRFNIFTSHSLVAFFGPLSSALCLWFFVFGPMPVALCLRSLAFVFALGPFVFVRSFVCSCVLFLEIGFKNRNQWHSVTSYMHLKFAIDWLHILIYL